MSIDTLSTPLSMMNGAIISWVNISALHPLFTVKTFVMTKNSLPAPKLLYRGYSANLICDVANQAVAFCAHNVISKKAKELDRTSEIDKIWQGSLAGGFSAPLLTGLERLMILQQVQKKTELVTTTCRKILAQEGGVGAMKGFVPTLCRESVNSACFFGISYALHKRISRIIPHKKTAEMTSFIASGMLAGFLTTPFDLIKTRVQKTIGPTSTREVIQEIMRTHKGGRIRPFFTGCGARMATIGSTMAGMGYLSLVVPKLLIVAFPKQLEEQ